MSPDKDSFDPSRPTNSSPTSVSREYIVIDESGDPGIKGNPIYLLTGMHVSEDVLDRLRRHVTAFRYHHDVVKEMKVQRWADKLTEPTRHLLTMLAEMTDAGEIVTTANWLDKETYQLGRGPYLAKAGTTMEFRHYQLRRLLERHRGRTAWGQETDLVIDRWRMTLDQRANLETYLRGNYNIRPPMAYVTLVDSLYCDPVQIVDIYGRLLRRVVQGGATQEEVDLAGRLMDYEELTGGLF
jgi:hypothetical protein